MTKVPNIKEFATVIILTTAEGGREVARELEVRGANAITHKGAPKKSHASRRAA